MANNRLHLPTTADHAKGETQIIAAQCNDRCAESQLPALEKPAVRGESRMNRPNKIVFLGSHLVLKAEGILIVFS